MNFENLTDEQWKLLWGVRRSIRYHGYRRRFWNNWHNIVMCLAVFSAASSIASFGGVLGSADHQWLHPLLMVVAATLIVLDTAIGFARKAALHDLLRRRFVDLERQIEKSSDSEIGHLADKRASIENDEPDTLHVLNDICHNEELIALGINEERLVIGWFQGLMANYFDWRRHSIIPEVPRSVS